MNYFQAAWGIYRKRGPTYNEVFGGMVERAAVLGPIRGSACGPLGRLAQR
jgi:hypothetical protein